MREAPFVGSIPIFIGDDLFDEAAFEAARAWGGGGVLVGAPRQTAARGRLQDPNEVCTWIEPQPDAWEFRFQRDGMGRLIVVSNRVNPPRDSSGGVAGGLAVALAASLREYSGIWFGWSGKTVETYTGKLNTERVGGVTVSTVDLDEQDHEEYYNGYANKTLWPLFHYRTDLTVYERAYDAGYDRVNDRFARAVRPLIEPEDFVWVHDYHMVPMARELRRLGVTNRIGFFLHIPWPARPIFTTLPRHKRLVSALIDYDLIGFQTADSREAFTDYIVKTAGGSVTEDGPGERLRQDGPGRGLSHRHRCGGFRRGSPLGIRQDLCLPSAD